MFERKASFISAVTALFIMLALPAAGLLGGCPSGQGFDSRLNAIVRPYRFSVAGWELRTVPGEIAGWFSAGPASTEGEVETVTDYFTFSARVKELESEIGAAITADSNIDLTALENELASLKERLAGQAADVESIIERQIREALADQGIYSPLVGPEIHFPPVSFKFEELPLVLVVSPRDRIESLREITLIPGLSLEEKEAIEGGVDGLGVSSLVVSIGGVATYPALVSDRSSLRHTLETTAEEWLHQYLAFTPLGWRYILDQTGLRRDYEIATMNETVASMASQEIAGLVWERYYAGSELESVIPVEEPEFDFNLEMREIRRAVDAYLAGGEIERAEEFMEQERQFLASMGYYIRKLNQAYFAFHGTYADSPTSTSPIGVELRELRGRSSSLKDFLGNVSRMTSRQALADSVS